MSLCKTCNKRDSCKKLCKAAKKEVDGVTHYQREQTWSSTVFESVPSGVGEFIGDEASRLTPSSTAITWGFLTERQRNFLEYREAGIPMNEIARKMKTPLKKLYREKEKIYALIAASTLKDEHGN